MHTRKFREFEWHGLITNGDRRAFHEMVDAYEKPVHEHLLGGFGTYLRHDLTLVSEAVWLAFHSYFNQPASFQPHRGSLLVFLQMKAVKQMQHLLQEENRYWQFQQLQFVLSRYVDNEQDLRLAKQLLKDGKNWGEFARILDVGAMPIKLMLREIKRNIQRVQQMLDDAPVDFAAMANRRTHRVGRQILRPVA